MPEGTAEATRADAWWLEKAVHADGDPLAWAEEWKKKFPQSELNQVLTLLNNEHHDPAKVAQMLGSQGDMAIFGHALSAFLRHPFLSRAAIETSLTAPSALREDVVSLTIALQGAFHGAGVIDLSRKEGEGIKGFGLDQRFRSILQALASQPSRVVDIPQSAPPEHSPEYQAFLDAFQRRCTLVAGLVNRNILETAERFPRQSPGALDEAVENAFSDLQEFLAKAQQHFHLSGESRQKIDAQVVRLRKIIFGQQQELGNFSIQNRLEVFSRKLVLIRAQELSASQEARIGSSDRRGHSFENQNDAEIAAFLVAHVREHALHLKLVDEGSLSLSEWEELLSDFKSPSTMWASVLPAYLELSHKIPEVAFRELTSWCPTSNPKTAAAWQVVAYSALRLLQGASSANDLLQELKEVFYFSMGERLETLRTLVEQPDNFSARIILRQWQNSKDYHDRAVLGLWSFLRFLHDPQKALKIGPGSDIDPHRVAERTAVLLEESYRRAQGLSNISPARPKLRSTP
ncbi:MAG TPA: hypothetical protein DF383_01655 [Deltaproteobacteria bacterium]|nr:hypothetical protein [Deltaproteobacteria bacterium]